MLNSFVGEAKLSWQLGGEMHVTRCYIVSINFWTCMHDVYFIVLIQDEAFISTHGYDEIATH